MEPFEMSKKLYFGFVVKCLILSCDHTFDVDNFAAHDEVCDVTFQLQLKVTTRRERCPFLQ